MRTWRKILPDFTIRKWTYADAKALHIDFIDEALEKKKWAFAADVVRFYALWKEGGVYMDSDIKIYRRFDEMLHHTACVTFNEFHVPDSKQAGMQAAFIMAEAGNQFCKDMIDYYRQQHFVKDDGHFNLVISPNTMKFVAANYGYEVKDEYQELPGLTVYPTRFLSPSKSYKRQPEAIGVHRVFGSWKHRSFGRKIDLKLHHVGYLFQYYFSR